MEMLKKVIGTSVVAAGMLFAVSANASTVVYEKVSVVPMMKFETEAFNVTTAGTYRATLSDFGFFDSFAHMGLAVTTSSELMGKIVGPGSFTFDANPGKYYASFAGIAGAPSMVSTYGIQIALVPEMETWAMMAMGLGLVGYMVRRRTRTDVKAADAAAA